jgi:hypothetical protein
MRLLTQGFADLISDPSGVASRSTVPGAAFMLSSTAPTQNPAERGACLSALEIDRVHTSVQVLG